MSKLNLEIYLDHLNTEQRKALAAFISIPAYRAEETVEPALDQYGSQKLTAAEIEVVAKQSGIAEAPQEVPKKKRAAGKKTETSSEAFEDKTRPESEADKYFEAKEVEAPEAVETAAETNGDDVTLDDLRALVTPAVLDNHRAELKAEIERLGGTKLANMPESSYRVFKKFLIGLE